MLFAIVIILALTFAGEALNDIFTRVACALGGEPSAESGLVCTTEEE